MRLINLINIARGAVLFGAALPLSSLAGSQTLFEDSQSSPFASGSATVNFGSYNASSITISVQVSAYCGSQQGGGRNYAGYAEAVIGSSRQTQDVPSGSDPISVSASNNLTVTKGADGNWYSGGVNVGSSVSVSGYAWADGENGVGYGWAYASVSWTEAPSTYQLTTSVDGSGAVTGGGTYTAGSVATVSATPSSGWDFNVWQGALSGTDTPATITMDSNKSVTAVFSLQQPANTAPIVSWNIQPGTVASGVPFTISAHGHDNDDNLIAVDIDKNGVPFAYGGGGDGRDADIGNPDTVTGPATITYTARARDGAGASSGWISQTVTVRAPNSPPTISWNTQPGTVTSGQTFTISAHGHDNDGDLAAVDVDKNGVPFAYGGGGNGTDADSGNPDSATGPATITYTARARDWSGASSDWISQTVTVTAPPSVSGSITASPSSATAPGSTTITWSTTNATSVSVSGNGLSSTAASGSQLVTGLAAGTYSYTLTAQGYDGPITRSVTFTVNPPASTPVAASITATPTSATAPGSTTIAWSSSNATSVSVTGNGLNSSAASGSQTVTGLPAGTYSYTITAQGSGGPAMQTATFTVNAPASVSGSISASPTTATAPGSSTISWSTTNATSVSVSGPGLSTTAVSGTQVVGNLPAGSHTYTLTAQGNGGPITRTATFTVSAAAPQVSATISASPTTATAPGSSTISWSSSAATSVSVSGPGLGSSAVNGSQAVSGLAAGTHTYTLTAQGNGGPVTRTATVTVSGGPTVTASIGVFPTTMVWGGTAALTWTTSNATAVRVSGFGITGSPYQYYPSLTIYIGGLNPGVTTWTLIAEGPGGPVTRTVSITVTTNDGLYGSITTNPTVIYSNQSATLNWTTTGANFRWVHGYTPGMNGVNIYPAAASGSTTISGLAPGDYRFVIEYGPGSSTTRMSFADLTVLGVNRTVSASVSPPGAGAVTGAGTYREGDSATLTATAGSEYVFTGWSGSLSSSSNPLTFTVGAQDYSLVANFQLRTYNVTTSVNPAGAGSVTGGGAYIGGSTATLKASAGRSYRFTGWSGGASGASNPVSFVVTADTSVTANFAPLNYSLITAASGGGSVTPGGAYPAGSGVTISATADSFSRFTGWTGDASGASNPLLVTMDRDKSITGLFTSKLPQSIAFSPPGTVRLDATDSATITLTARASSGLPVAFSLTSGAATVDSNVLTISGPGPVVVAASQPGDETYLAAPAVQRTINGVSAASLIQDTRNDKVHSSDAPGNSSLIKSN